MQRHALALVLCVSARAAAQVPVARVEVDTTPIHPALAAYLAEAGAPMRGGGGSRVQVGTASPCADGSWCTAQHVVGTAPVVRLTVDGDTVDARVIGRAAGVDLAVLDGPPAPTIPPTAAAEPGDEVALIGFDGGVTRTERAARVVAVVPWRIPRHAGRPLLRLDAPIRPGASGGPVLRRGAPVGVLVAGSTADSPLGGDSLAVPQAAWDRAARWARGAAPGRRAGVTVAPDPGGVRVVSVDPDGPADRAGVRPGDRVIGIDGASIAGVTDLADAIAGGAATWAIVRDGATLGRRVAPEVPARTPSTPRVAIDPDGIRRATAYASGSSAPSSGDAANSGASGMR